MILWFSSICESLIRTYSYFNTVGSKEGWTPSAFVSSKSNRKKDIQSVQQRPEDFMDQEDIADAEESKKLATSDSFAGIGSTEEEVLRQGAFMDILRVTGDTMGVKLLRKMGWKDGQGVGPKVRRKARLNDEDGKGNTDGQETHLFAPENSKMISFVRKNDHKGLGFEGEGRLTDNSTNGTEKEAKQASSDQEDAFTSKSAKQKPRPQARRGGFGVGILNDNGSDDEDPYHMGPQISYNRIIGGDKKKKKKPNLETSKTQLTSSSNPLLRSKPIFISKKASKTSSTGFRRCHDGRLPLPGFILSTPLKPDHETKYPPPIIPADWKSSRTPSTQSSKPSNTPNSSSQSQATAHNPTTRANLLGETPLPSKSVFDYLTPSARARLATATQNPNLPAAGAEPPPSTYVPAPSPSTTSSSSSLIPPLSPRLASTALARASTGWTPYATDATKRARYLTFLSISANIRPGLPDRAPGTSDEDWANEMREFAHSATIFKPMSGMMASRFTSSNSGGAPAVKVENEELLSRPVKKSDPAEEAARLGMFGQLTREVKVFYPSRLLCKRFNVRVPEHVMPEGEAGAQSGGAAARSAGTGVDVGGFGSRFQYGGFQTAESREGERKGKLELVGEREMEALKLERGMLGGEGVKVEEVERVVVDPERNEALEKERPGEAVFRAIFGDGSDSEDE